MIPIPATILFVVMSGLVITCTGGMDVVATTEVDGNPIEEYAPGDGSSDAPIDDGHGEILRGENTASCATGGTTCGEGFKCTCKCTKVRSSAREETGYQAMGLSLHNQYRARHKAPELELKDELNQVAVTCAKFYAAGGAAHKCVEAETYGENIAGSSSSAGAPSVYDTCKQGIERWYNEKENYDYEKPGEALPGKKIGHFTQLVWVGSNSLGLGGARNESSGWTRCVAIYDPRGNTKGKYKANVLH